MLYELEMIDDDRTRETFAYLFTSPMMQWYWSRARSVRLSTAGQPDTRLRRFQEIVDEVYRRLTANTQRT
jgi:hypothetical protein